MKLLKFIAIILTQILFMSCDKDIHNRDMSIGVFGGSQCSLPAGDPIKMKWAEYFNADVVVCGIGGAGFGLWQEKNVLNQLKSNQIFDVYIFWCSTNDHIKITESDDENDPNTQAGGLKLCLDYIQKVNPNAQILLFTSLWVPHKGFKTISKLVDSQIAFCEKHNIPYLNQHNPNILVESDFWDDKLHFGTETYWKLEVMQTDFLNKYVIINNNENQR